MRRILFCATVALTSAFNATAEAAPECGKPYVIRAGDTLSAMSSLIYQDATAWPNIYEFRENSSRIGSNPNNISVGVTLDMPPCPGQLSANPPQTVSRPASATTSNQAPRGQFTFAPTIDILTGSDYAPFTDETLPGRGMLTQVVEAAFAASDLPNDYKVDFINDWGSHLSLLLPRNKYDFGFPWFRPDCTDPSALPESMQVRCEYEWSQPIYTVTVALFGPKNNPTPPQSFDDLRGKVICRPSGYFIFDLAAHGLRDGETFTLSRPTTVRECFDQLERGRVDYVSINRFTGEKALAEAGLRDFIEPVPTLVEPLSFRVVAYRDNAEAAYTWMEEFNKGLNRIRANGMWDEIVNWHLERHRASLTQ